METFRRDHSRALSAIGVIALLAGLLVPGEQLRAQDVDKDGLYSRPFLVLDPDMHTAPLKAMVTDAAGRYIITGSHDKTVRVWSADDGRLLRTIRLPSGPGREGQVLTLAVSPDGNTIAAAGEGQNIFLFERATGRQVGRIGPWPNSVIDKLAFSHDGRRIAAGMRNPDASLRLFDVDSRREIALDDNYKGAIYGISFDTTGRIATTSDDGKLRLYDRDLKLIRDARAPGPPELQPFQIAFSPDNKRLAVGYDGPIEGRPRVDVVDGQTLVKLFTPSTTGYSSGSLNNVAWSLDGSILYAGNDVSKDRGRLVFAWKGEGRGSLQVFPAASNTIVDIRELSDGRVVVASMEPRLSLFDRKGSVLWKQDAPGADFRGQATTLKVSPDGKQVLFKFDRDDDKSLAAFDISKRALDLSPAQSPKLIAPRLEGLPITNWRNSEKPKIKGKPLAIDSFEISRSLAITRDARSFWLGSDWNLRHFDAKGALIRTIPPTTTVWALNLAG